MKPARGSSSRASRAMGVGCDELGEQQRAQHLGADRLRGRRRDRVSDSFLPAPVRCGSTCTGMSANSWRAISVAISTRARNPASSWAGPSSDSAVRYRSIIHNSETQPPAEHRRPGRHRDIRGQAHAGALRKRQPGPAARGPLLARGLSKPAHENSSERYGSFGSAQGQSTLFGLVAKLFLVIFRHGTCMKLELKKYVRQRTTTVN